MQKTLITYFTLIGLLITAVNANAIINPIDTCLQGDDSQCQFTVAFAEQPASSTFENSLSYLLGVSIISKIVEYQPFNDETFAQEELGFIVNEFMTLWTSEWANLPDVEWLESLLVDMNPLTLDGLLATICAQFDTQFSDPEFFNNEITMGYLTTEVNSSIIGLQSSEVPLPGAIIFYISALLSAPVLSKKLKNKNG